MIGPSRYQRAVEALQEETATLRTETAALHAQVAALGEQLAALSSQAMIQEESLAKADEAAAKARGEAARMKAGIGALEGVVAAQASAIAAQTGEIAALAVLAPLVAAQQDGLARTNEELAEAGAAAEQLKTDNASLEEAVAVQAATIDAQAAAITALQANDDEREEAIKQFRGHLARLERQAALDVDEMRQTHLALAASVLLKRAANAGASSERQDDS